MKNKNELYYFAGKILAIDDNPAFIEEFIQYVQADEIDWESFVVLCSNHLILPVIYLKLKKQGLLEHLPGDLSEYLSEVHQLNINRNIQIEKQLEEASLVLNQGGVQPVFLKGAANMLDGLYHDVGERIMSDVDFLVSEKDFFHAAELLKGIGYLEVKETEEWNDVLDAKHYPRLYRTDCVANIEIHRIPVDPEFVGRFNTSVIDTEKKKLRSISGFVPSYKHRVVHNFIHSQLSNEGHLLGLVSLREIYDLYLLSKKCDLKDVLTEVESKRKAKAYFAFAGQVLGIDGFYTPKSYSFYVLRMRHALNNGSDGFRKFYTSMVFLCQRILVGYIGLAIRSVYSRKSREYFYRRITNKDWYVSHANLYKSFFKKDS